MRSCLLQPDMMQKKYKEDRPVRAARKRFVPSGDTGDRERDFGWRIESSGYQDQEPFEIMVEREDVKKWFFVPVTKRISQKKRSKISC